MFGPGDTCRTRLRALVDLPGPSQGLNWWRTSRNHDHPPCHDVTTVPIRTHPGSAPYTTFGDLVHPAVPG